MALPTVNIQGVIYPIDEIYDLDLYADKTLVPVYQHPDQKTPIYYVQPGKYIGKVWSNVYRESRIIWQLETTPGKYIYVPHETQSLSLSALKQQGAKSQEEIIKEQEAQNRRDTSFLGIDWENVDLSTISGAKNYILIALAIILLIFIVK